MDQQPQSLSVLLINPRLPLLMQTIDVFKDKRPEPVVVVPTVEEAIARAQAGLPCVLIFSIVEDADVIACIQMCKTLSLERRDGMHRLIVVSVKDNKKLQDSVLNRGASEFVNSKTAPSGLVFKTTRLLAQIQRHLDKMGDQSKVVLSSQSRGAAGGPGMVIVKGPAFNMSEEVIAEDTWVIHSTPPKKVGSRWAVEIEGPDPDSGSWEPLGENAQGEEQWAWHPLGFDGKVLPPEAKQNLWIFVGQRPSYDLESEKWKMVSVQSELFYQMGKQKGPSKFKLDSEKGIIFSQDIPQAAERIAKSKVVGGKVRHDRILQAANKTTNHTGAGGAAAAAGKTSISTDNQPTPEYEAIESVGVLRANKKEVPLDRVPCEEFGHPEGNWEPVKQQGWAFVTPEMKARGLAGLPKLAPFWLLDKKQTGTKPYFDSNSESWLFEKTQMPRKIDKYEDLPPIYQDFLNTTAQAQMSIDTAKAGAELSLKQEGERTSQKYESIRDVPSSDRPHKTPLNFFFKMSLLANSGVDSAEFVSHIASNVATIVPIESITLLKPSPDKDKSKAIVACSTSERLKEGRVLELEKLPFREAMVQTTPQNFEVTKELCVSSYPILNADGTSLLGCMLLFYSKVNQPNVIGQRGFIEKVMKQLSRVYQTAA